MNMSGECSSYYDTEVFLLYLVFKAQVRHRKRRRLPFGAEFETKEDACKDRSSCCMHACRQRRERRASNENADALQHAA